MVTAHSLQVGDIILIEAGSEIISDGVLLSTTATVSQSLLTGEGDLIIKTQAIISLAVRKMTANRLRCW